MTMFHFFNCAILTFGPHFVYYSATPLANPGACHVGVGGEAPHNVRNLPLTNCQEDVSREPLIRDSRDVATIRDLSRSFPIAEQTSEYDTLGTSMRTAIVYLVTALVKLVCLATFLKVSDSENFDPYQELLKASIGFIDVAGLYVALTQLTHRNISQNHKFQAVGLGWAFADSVLHRLAPLWVGARGLEFTWDFILQGLEANADLDSSSGAKHFSGCIGVLDVAQEKQAKDTDTHNIPLCWYSGHHAIYHEVGLLLFLASALYNISVATAHLITFFNLNDKDNAITYLLEHLSGLSLKNEMIKVVIGRYLRRGMGWKLPEVVGFQLLSSLVIAFISWQLFAACQRPSF
ncbi:hypothetical protein RDABS01_010654 [Bienertia sinuspersici]